MQKYKISTNAVFNLESVITKKNHSSKI